MDAGFEILSVLIGLFAVSELLNTAAHLHEKADRIETRVRFSGFFPPLRETLSGWRSYLRASAIGTFMGLLPGIGGGPGGLLAYAQEKRASKTPEKFGTGMPEGLIASETSNNAITGGALIPMLTLGIPGDATTAIIMGGFIVGVGILGLDPMEYYTFTQKGFNINNLWVGMVHGAVYGMLIAITGCYQGLRCGRNAEAVGKATTSAVVYSIVGIVLSTAVLTILCNILNI